MAVKIVQNTAAIQKGKKAVSTSSFCLACPTVHPLSFPSGSLSLPQCLLPLSLGLVVSPSQSNPIWFSCSP